LTCVLGALAFWAPKVFKDYKDHLEPLFEKNPGLKFNFPNSIFPAATFNLGPRTVSLDHLDSANAAAGFCPIFCAGSFDSKKGGHLILYDLKKIIEFPPGSTILVPSSTMRHGNTPIQPGEERMSFTQYCAGGLIRWVKYGYRSGKTLEKTAEGRAFKAKVDGDPDIRWKEALAKFSKLSEVEADRQTAFT
ncbi:hypothetical protein PLICRDRAFT_119376, partial [Plicaturopsis crispa FD-325 SS-3]